MNADIEKQACSIAKKPTADDISAMVKAAVTIIAVGVAILISCIVIDRISGSKTEGLKEVSD
jgi:hypothetical protein